jgi:hypothetical protein
LTGNYLLIDNTVSSKGTIIINKKFLALIEKRIPELWNITISEDLN